ncbi:Ankyrin_repeat-containing protein [Hexamita inflata]|uniref:Ankyrin repeat-containing protein n=1 Tax=Hexamita inflata TaxID=28002 RepID=A0AA86V5Q9_9EUKA|nr:Ankyrin repeat-containing protein [Hexamita inflata]
MEDNEADLALQQLRLWFRSANNGDIDYIKSNMQYMNKTDQWNKTALMIASLGNFVNVATLVIDEAGYSSPLKESAIFFSIDNRNTAMLQLLAPKEFMLVNNTNILPIMYAVNKNWPEGVRILAPYYRTHAAVLDEFSGKTPLIKAILMQKFELVKACINQADMCDISDKHPVLYALESQDHQIAQLLITQSKSKQNFLQIHIKTCKNLHICDLLQHFFGSKNEFNQTTLMILCQRKELHELSNREKDAMQKMIVKEIKQRDRFGQTALMHAAKSNNVQMIQILLRKEQRMKDNCGNTAMMHAVINNHIDAIKLLAEEEKNEQNNQGSTALKLAVVLEHNDIVQFLSNVESDEMENNAVEHAVLKNQKGFLETLNKQYSRMTPRQQEMSFELTSQRTTLEKLKNSLVGTDVSNKVQQRHIFWGME